MTGRDNDKSGICCEQQAGPPTSFQAAITQELNSGIGYCFWGDLYFLSSHVVLWILPNKTAKKSRNLKCI
jgi:hypothetical protein